MAVEVCHIRMASSSLRFSLIIFGQEKMSVSISDPVSHEGDNQRDPLLGTSEGFRYGLRLFKSMGFLIYQEADLLLVTYYTFCVALYFAIDVFGSSNT